jgi:Zn-dependent protease
MSSQLFDGLVYYLILVLSIALHEFGHAKSADLLGDPLPRLQGRVTLNPLAHLDPIGTGLIPLSMIFLPILMNAHLPLALIGWGKPVQIALNNPRNRIRNEILITLAGPAMNFLIALGVAILIGLYLRFDSASATAANLAGYAQLAILLNCLLIAFNLIPLPPLDGSRILRHIVCLSEETFYRLAVNSPWILLILVNLSVFQQLLGLVRNWIAAPFFALANFLSS